MKPQKYRKKPVVIEAMLYSGPASYEALTTFGVDFGGDVDGSIEIWNTAEKCNVRCHVGHYVIRGIRGEFYPCDPGIFAETYEEVQS